MYISSSGTLQEKQSLFRLSIFSEIFWAIVNFIGLFFSTMFGGSSSSATRGGRVHQRRRPGGGGGPGGGGPKPRGFPDSGTRRIGRVPPPAAGG